MRTTGLRLSSRVSGEKPSPVTALLATKRRLLAQGRDLIDLSLGDPAFPPPPVAVEAVAEAFADPSMSRYGYQVGYAPFREAVARYMSRRFGVEVNPHEEVLPVIGAMDGLTHLALVVTDPGDSILLPDPSFLVYQGARLSAAARVHSCPLTAESQFLLPFDELPVEVLEDARLAYLNYPNNPTGAVAPLEYLERAVDLCGEFGIVLAHDAAYIEVGFDGYRAPSILQVPGARDVAIEFHSLSKTFAMSGWRIGWAVGNRSLIEALASLKSYLDTGPLLAVQRAAVPVLDQAAALSRSVVDAYGERHRAAAAALEQQRIPYWNTSASPFLWVTVPPDQETGSWADHLLEEAGVAVWAGTAFGPAGDGFVRLALAESPARITEAVERMARYYR